MTMGKKIQNLENIRKANVHGCGYSPICRQVSSAEKFWQQRF